MLNVVAIMGRLVADPELRTTPAGVNVCRFRIACDRSFVRQGEQRQADFIDIVAWRAQAEFVCRYFSKGSLIAIDGRIETSNYQGQKRQQPHLFCYRGQQHQFCRVQEHRHKADG